MGEFIDVFVGADRSQLLAVAVLDHSIRRHTERPVRVTPLIDLELPEPQDIRQGSRTNFSFTRFTLPELKGRHGKAIYLDADMQVFRDIGELWDMPFEGAKIVIQQDLPPERAKTAKAGAPAKRHKQCAVMLVDCERTDWDVRVIVAGLDGRYSYEELMYEMCILPESDIRYGLPFEWNSLEHYDSETRLIHYTDMNTQPWVAADNPFGRLWMREIRLMFETGAISRRNLEREIELGYFRPSLWDELIEAPHEAGFNAQAAKRYEESDRKAGFVKHAEVNARKKQRAEAVKAYEQRLKAMQSAA